MASPQASPLRLHQGGGATALEAAREAAMHAEVRAVAAHERRYEFSAASRAAKRQQDVQRETAEMNRFSAQLHRYESEMLLQRVRAERAAEAVKCNPTVAALTTTA
eukprot:TRINITY_DN6499_c0_g2_i1.p1 TRINITY_DN6499_c0_g2~~TRINITY_DN6499_c0_g2_i1.p1  ORF type:complete len:106 (+),score=44.35 TRINITY_DN6499_c0_g2_i1:74-391(+)